MAGSSDAHPGRAAPGRATSGRRLPIGKVLAELREEFPDVTASKIRFLESEGLVTPERKPSGYRTFSEADLYRLRYILAAQRDRFWPLKVIREALDALDRGLREPDNGAGPPRPPAPTIDPGLPDGPALLATGTVALTQAELRASAGIDRDTFDALETFGLIQADARGHFSLDALSVAAAARSLADHGLEPRHLRSFRTAADREIGLVQQVLATRRGDGTPAERAAEIAAACIGLHVSLVRAGLSR